MIYLYYFIVLVYLSSIFTNVYGGYHFDKINNDNNSNNNNNTNYYDFALIWNPINNNKYNTNYTIHGLWPQYNSKSYPSYCDGYSNNTFELSNISGLVPTMNIIWVSTEEKNEDFWSHEWNKHGTCNWNNWTIQQYFSNTILTYMYHLEDLDKLCDEPEKDCIVKLDKNLHLLR